jgi:hypothetical protein
MHCYESALLRNWLFERVREVDPRARRDDLLLEQVLAELGIDNLGALRSLDAADTQSLVRRIADDVPMAA